MTFGYPSTLIPLMILVVVHTLILFAFDSVKRKKTFNISSSFLYTPPSVGTMMSSVLSIISLYHLIMYWSTRELSTEANSYENTNQNCTTDGNNRASETYHTTEVYGFDYHRHICPYVVFICTIIAYIYVIVYNKNTYKQFMKYFNYFVEYLNMNINTEQEEKIVDQIETSDEFCGYEFNSLDGFVLLRNISILYLHFLFVLCMLTGPKSVMQLAYITFIFLCNMLCFLLSMEHTMELTERWVDNRNIDGKAINNSQDTTSNNNDEDEQRSDALTSVSRSSSTATLTSMILTNLCSKIFPLSVYCISLARLSLFITGHKLDFGALQV